MNCETPTAVAEAAAIARNTTIAAFQPSKSSPNIRLTFFERVALTVCGMSIVGSLSIAVLPVDLNGANSLLAGQHQMSDAKPPAERLIRVLKNGAGDMREAIARIRSAMATPTFEGYRRDREHLIVATARTTNAFGPASRDQVRPASILIREHRVELRDGHLVNWLRTACHWSIHYREAEYGMTSQVPYDRPRNDGLVGDRTSSRFSPCCAARR
jgi:hypothetical protein